jgi:hypothetical protein
VEVPPGWHGWLLERLLARTIEANIDDSLRQLKRHAETRYAATEA